MIECHNIKRKKDSLSPFLELNGRLFVKTLSPLHTKIQLLCKVRLAVVLEKAIFFVSVFLPFLVKRSGPSFELPRIPFTSECVLPSLVEIGPLVLD